MKIPKKHICLSLIISFCILSCGSVPVTGRRQIKLIPAKIMLSMSIQQYDEFLGSNKLSNDRQNKNMVNKVGIRIQKAVEEYMAMENMTVKLKDYAWEFNLVDSPDLNAWAMPGGKVVIYTGILPVTEDETGLAVVMGHEIAHAIADHGTERFSHGLIVQVGSFALSNIMSKRNDKVQQAWMTAFGVGTQYGITLPFGRLQESEADHLGLIFMAMAGYDPNGAISFWERMAEMKEG
ncbi:MAG: M48 family metallopeptidase, partial [Candidatus Anammoxibacter sp.]